MKTPREALAFLVENGYAVDIGHGWHRVDKVPVKSWHGQTARGEAGARRMRDFAREVASFVKAIKILGAWSVATQSGPGAVELSTGVEPDEILFRLRVEMKEYP